MHAGVKVANYWHSEMDTAHFILLTWKTILSRPGIKPNSRQIAKTTIELYIRELFNLSKDLWLCSACLMFQAPLPDSIANCVTSLFFSAVHNYPIWLKMCGNFTIPPIMLALLQSSGVSSEGSGKCYNIQRHFKQLCTCWPSGECLGKAVFCSSMPCTNSAL